MLLVRRKAIFTFAMSIPWPLSISSWPSRRRESLDLAIVNLAACIRVSGGSCEDLRIFLGAVGPTVIRAHHAESVLKGCLLQDSLIKSAGNLVANEIRPISDIRASAEYRREISRVIIIRVLKDIMKGRTFKS